jgi:outer membrane biosynthesis protein TonB
MKEEDMNHLRQQDQNLRDALQQEEAALPQMPADLNARLMQRMESEQPKQHRTLWRWMAAAACLLLLIGIGTTLLPRQQQDEPLVAQQSVEPQTEAPKAEPEPQAEELQQEVAQAEVQPSQKPVKKQRKVMMKRVELIPTSEAKSTNMKTLSASLIAKVKAYDQQSDLSRTTGIDEGIDEVVEEGIDDTDPLVAMAAQVEDIRQRGMRLHEEIRQQMKN